MSVRLPTNKHNNIKNFDGTPWYSLVAMYYLNNNYKNNCVVIPFHGVPDDHTDISLRWIQEKGKEGYLHIPDNFWEEFKKHLEHSHDKRFIVFPFGFTCSESGGHANFMLYDLKNKTLERFDSIGKSTGSCLNVKDLDNKIKNLFTKNMGTNFVKEYLKPFTQFEIFQELQDDEDVGKLKTDPTYGFCSVWACWWIELRFLNPDITRDELIDLALEELFNKHGTLTEFIRKYAQNIVNHAGHVSNCIKINKNKYKSQNKTTIRQSKRRIKSRKISKRKRKRSRSRRKSKTKSYKISRSRRKSRRKSKSKNIYI